MLQLYIITCAEFIDFLFFFHYGSNYFWNQLRVGIVLFFSSN